MRKLLTNFLAVALFFSFFTIPCKAAEEVKQKYINYKGTKVYTEAYNYSSKSKEAIIFLHGLGGDHSHGKFLYDKSNPYLTISLDYLDHGNSGHMPTVTWNSHLGEIKAVLDSYGIKKAHFVGHSFGADTAMMFAKKYPNYVKDIVLLDRAHFNFKDYEQFNTTKNLISVLEYNPQSTLSKEEFSQYLDMSWDNDITKTWNIKKNVLLLGANNKNFLGDPSSGMPSLSNIVTMIKSNPSDFGVDPKIAETLPNVTEKDSLNLVQFLKRKVCTFKKVNKRFTSIQTDFTHGNMVRDPQAMVEIRNYTIKYIKNNLK